jgi:predicted N-acetyltransferase YhbS
MAVKDFEIRKLKASDAEEISRIHAAIIRTSLEEGFKQNIEAQANKRENASFVAVLNGQVVGYMITRILSGVFGIKKSAWIAMMGVSPDYMGQGIGESLANRVFDLAREKGLKDVYISVQWDSPDILSFCKNLGFDRSKFINLIKRL